MKGRIVEPYLKRPTKYTDQKGKVCQIRWRKLKKDSGSNTEGLIVINTNKSIEWQAITLWHELTHQAASCLYIDDPVAGLDEVIVGCVSTNQTTIWSRNPLVIEWIHAGLTGRVWYEEPDEPAELLGDA